MFDKKPDCGIFQAGGTKFHLKDWKRVTHDPVILEYTQGVRVDFDGLPTQRDDLEEFRHSEKSRRLITEEILKLREKGVVE